MITKVRIDYVVFAIFLCININGCQAANATDLVVSDKPRDSAPAISDDDFNNQIDSNNEFACNLYSELKDASGNIFFSPFSISTALAMTYEGARTDTEKQIAETLHFQQRSVAHKAFNKLDLSLAEQSKQSKTENKKGGFKLEIANSIWAQKDFKWLPAFLDVLKINYGAGIFTADFIRETEKYRLKINKWVEEKTHDKIKDLLQPGVLNDMTRMVLVNAIYFYGQWLLEFDKENTHDGDFTLFDNSRIKVPFMHQTEEYFYSENELFQSLEMRYKDCDLAMLVLLPKIEKFSELESKLDNALLKEAIDKLESREVILTFPKVKMDAQFELASILASMGMPDAFTEQADFSGMDGARDLFISHVIHKAFVAIDERGTEAAAATAVLMELTAAPAPTEPVEFKADHPFIFLIRDKQTGSILFLGRILDPR